MSSLATTRFGGGQHTILMAETDPINFAKVSHQLYLWL